MLRTSAPTRNFSRLLGVAIALGSAVAISFLSGCALLGGGSEIQRANKYAIATPTGWTARSTNGESDQAFKLPSGSIVTVTSSCNQNTTNSLEVMTKHLLMGARNINFSKRTKMSVAGQEGLYSTLTANYDGHPFHLEVFVLPKNSCIFDFTLMNSRNIPPKDSEEFTTFIKTFSYGTN